MMFDIALDDKSPLYGRAQEILRLTPIPISFLPKALGVPAKEAVQEYTIWGGVPRYWELREKYDSLKSALRDLALSPYGVLYDEPTHILRDDMREAWPAREAFTTLTEEEVRQKCKEVKKINPAPNPRILSSKQQSCKRLLRIGPIIKFCKTALKQSNRNYVYWEHGI